MKFLEICRRVLQDSGTGYSEDIPDTADTVAIDVDGHPGRVVRFVQQAWRELQIGRDDWLWMDREFTFQTVAGTHTYAHGDMLEADGTTKSFPNGLRTWYTNRTWYIGTGGARIVHMAYQTWRERQRTGTPPSGEPNGYTIDPSRRLRLYPNPDAQYLIEGSYQSGVQELVNAGDVPDLPEEFHETVVWRAVMMVHGYDTAVDSSQFAVQQFKLFYSPLLRSQAPGWVPTQPLA